MISTREPPCSRDLAHWLRSGRSSGKKSAQRRNSKSSMSARLSPPTRAPLLRGEERGRTRRPWSPWYRHHRPIRRRDSIFALGRSPQKRRAGSRAADAESGQSGFRSRGGAPGLRCKDRISSVAPDVSARSRNHLRLVESALRLLALVQGNGNHLDRPRPRREDRPSGHRLFQLGNRLCQHAPQKCRRRTNLLNFEQMNQVAQFTVITSIGNRPLERRVHAPTKRAPRLPVNRLLAIRFSALHAGWKAQGFSADGAVGSLERLQREQTGSTDGKAGNSKQRGATDATIGGKESEE